MVPEATTAARPPDGADAAAQAVAQQGAHVLTLEMADIKYITQDGAH